MSHLASCNKQECGFEESSPSSLGLYMRLGSGILEYDATLYGSMPRSLLLISHHSMSNACGGLLTCITLIAPFLLYTQGRRQIKRLQQSRSKAKVPFFWAVASLAHVFNIYMTYNALVVVCFRPGSTVETEHNVCLLASYGVIYALLTMCLIAYIHSQYINFPIPKTWDILSRQCCGGKQYRVIRMLSIWASTTVLCACYYAFHFNSC